MKQTPQDIANAYLEAVARRDYAAARAYLADEGFEYLSPLNCFSTAEPLIAYLELATPIVQRVDVRKVFSDGDDVCHIVTVTSQISEKRASTVVQWSRVVQGKIRRIELIFDAHEYKKLLE